MKLYYIANVRIPTEKAHGIQIMKMCEAFSKRGVEVELVVPNRINQIKDDPFFYYNVESNFNINKLFTIDLVKFGRIGFLIQNFTFSLSVFLSLLFKKDEILYTRDEVSAFFLSFISKEVFWEVHDGRCNFIVKRILKRVKGIIAITDGLKKYYMQKGVSENRILVAPDGVDLKKFDIEMSKDETRQKISLPQDKKIILYTGHLYGWKGVDTLAESARNFGEEVLFVFVGGTEKDIKSFKEKYSNIKNILIIGQKLHSDIPFYLSSADVLILPNSGKEDISRLYTSPMKLFEYMASGVPIVASDLPSIREILNESNAAFFEPDDPMSLADSIKKVLHDERFGDKISKQALKDAEKYTWRKRADLILKFINV